MPGSTTAGQPSGDIGSTNNNYDRDRGDHGFNFGCLGLVGLAGLLGLRRHAHGPSTDMRDTDVRDMRGPRIR